VISPRVSRGGMNARWVVVIMISSGMVVGGGITNKWMDAMRLFECRGMIVMKMPKSLS